MPRHPVLERLLAAAAMCAALSAIAADAPLTADQVRDVLAQNSSYRSSDGLTLVVGGKDLPGADALRLCQFSTDVRKRLSSHLSIPMDGPAFTTEIRVLSTIPEKDAYVACSVLPQGMFRIHVWVAGLGEVNQEDVAGALCGGLLRSDALAHGWTDAEGQTVQLGAAPYPVWFGTGVARLLNVANRQYDAEHTIELLESERLPGLAALLSAGESLAQTDRAVASQLVAWLASDGMGPEGFRGLRKRVLSDGGWAAAAGFPDAEAAAEGEKAWREWLQHRKWVILTPGMSHPAFVRRVRDLLLLAGEDAEEEPEEGDVDKEEKPPRKSRIPPEVFAAGPLDPEALLRHSREPWAPEAAVAMSGRLQRSLAGHGQDLLAVAAGYGAYFQAVAERRPPSELRRLLDDAEALLAALEKGGGESEP
jgi:hypothetical protein